jgi:hypothetical protein
MKEVIPYVDIPICRKCSRAIRPDSLIRCRLSKNKYNFEASVVGLVLPDKCEKKLEQAIAISMRNDW